MGDNIDTVYQESRALEAEIERLRDVLSELVECAELRGDNELPKPEDDPVLWSARMQTAWDEAERVIGGEDE